PCGKNGTRSWVSQSATGHDTFWDYMSLPPESLQMGMGVLSDPTLTPSLRMIEGFGVHSFRLINAAGKSTFVKFHWRPKLGLQSTIWDETVKISGADQDYHRRDMFEATKARRFPDWEFAVQLFTQEEADYHPGFQQIAFVDTETGELQERRLQHREEAEKFYRDLAAQGMKVRVGMEASGHARWFERLLAELQFELWIGDAAEISTKRVRKQKTDRQDAQLILELMLEDRFPQIWVP